MMKYEIPLTPEAQMFQISLGGETYSLTVLWSTAVMSWLLNIADSTGVGILSSIPLIPGVDLLEPFSYLHFGGGLVVESDKDLDMPPDYEKLGVSSHLYFVVAE